MSLCFLTVTYHVVSSKCMLLAEKARSWPVSTWFPYMQSCGALDWEVSPVHSCGNVCQPQGANPGWSWTPHTFLLVKAMNMRVCACLVWTYICLCAHSFVIFTCACHQLCWSTPQFEVEFLHPHYTASSIPPCLSLVHACVCVMGMHGVALLQCTVNWSFHLILRRSTSQTIADR